MRANPSPFCLPARLERRFPQFAEQVVDKAPDAYRTISEVADELDLPQHVLRFWETRFAQIRPLKRGGGRRYYRPEDIDLLRGIRHLLYGQGYTIRGVQRIIKESGVKAIQALGRGEGFTAPAKPGGPDIVAPVEPQPVPAEPPRPGIAASLRGLFAPNGAPPTRAEPPIGWSHEVEPEPPPTLAAEPEASGFDEPFDDGGEEMVPEPPVSAPARRQPVRPEPVAATVDLPAPPVRPVVAAPAEPPATARGQTLRFAPAVLAPEDVRRLQAALYELTECRRRLDQVLDGG